MSEFFVAIIVIFTPGILAAVVCDKICFHQKWDSFKFSVYAFLLGVLSYLLVQLIFTMLDVLYYFRLGSVNWYQLRVWNSLLQDRTSLSLSEIIYATIASLPVALLASWIINNRLFNKLAWFMGVTTKYGDDNLFSYQLNAEEMSWVHVRDFKNNLTYQGQVSSYSETPSLQEIVICKVSVYRYEDSAYLYDAPCVYLATQPGALVIEAISPDNLEKING